MPVEPHIRWGPDPAWEGALFVGDILGQAEASLPLQGAVVMLHLATITAATCLNARSEMFACWQMMTTTRLIATPCLAFFARRMKSRHHCVALSLCMS